MSWFLSTASVPTIFAGVHVLIWLAASYAYMRNAFLVFAVGVGEARRSASAFGWVLAFAVLVVDPFVRFWVELGMVGWTVAYGLGMTAVALALAFRSWYEAHDYEDGMALHNRLASGRPLTGIESARMHRALEQGEPTRVLSNTPHIDVTVRTSSRKAIGAARRMIGR